MIAKGYTFASETDTEVLVKLIDSCYQGEPLQALQAALAKVRGSYALAVLFKDYPDTIFAVKRESPLIVGWGEGEKLCGIGYPGAAQVHPQLQRAGRRGHGRVHGTGHPLL